MELELAGGVGGGKMSGIRNFRGVGMVHSKWKTPYGRLDFFIFGAIFGLLLNPFWCYF